MSASPSDAAPAWRPLNREQRRVAGVLIEKAKTTPDAYPMTLNAITTACNQKSNRHPLMELDAETVERVLDELREMKAVAEIQGTGRSIKFRHQLYAWLGVDKVELAVMGELLLRGEQTLGELRGRAARMEPIADLNELKPIVQRLIERKLVVELTPSGRGQLVTHHLYGERELQRVRDEALRGVSSDAGSAGEPHEAVDRAPQTPNSGAAIADRLDELQRQIDVLAARVDDLARLLQ